MEKKAIVFYIGIVIMCACYDFLCTIGNVGLIGEAYRQTCIEDGYSYVEAREESREFIEALMSNTLEIYMEDFTFGDVIGYALLALPPYGLFLYCRGRRKEIIREVPVERIIYVSERKSLEETGKAIDVTDREAHERFMPH